MGFSRQEHWSGVRALLQGFTGMGGHCYACLSPTPPLMGQLEAMILCL